MNYSYLKEVYQVESLPDKKKVKKKKNPEYLEEFTNEQTNSEKPSLKTPFERQLETPKTSVKQNIEPYYDDELEKYLDVKNSNHEINMNYTPIDDGSNYIDDQFSRTDIQNNSGYNNRYIPQNGIYSRFAKTSKPNNTNYMRYNDDNLEYYSEEKSDSSGSSGNIYTSTPPVNAEVQQTNTQPQNTDNDMFFKHFINIGLFIFIGILIIFLCEQITEIAIGIGMKRTVSILEPYLRKKL